MKLGRMRQGSVITFACVFACQAAAFSQATNPATNPATAFTKPTVSRTDGPLAINEARLGVHLSGATSPKFSADGLHVAYIASRGKLKVVVADGTAGPEFGEIDPPVLSPDGKRVGYSARK